MCEKLTRVELFYLEDRVNYWLQFGDFSFDKNIDRIRAFAWFKPDQLCCYIRWWANDYGTQDWTLAILRSSVGYGDNMQSYPGVHPGAEILLQVRGKTYVKRILIILDEIESQGVNLSEVSPDYYRYLGQSILARRVPHSYSIEQHLAFLKRSDVGL